MDLKKRKIISRIGAALFLGMSLFNFGAIWNKQRSGMLPRKSQNYRKKEKEDLGELDRVSQVVEEEASAVISQMSQENQNQQQLQEESNSFSESVVRYGAIGIWTLSAGILFSSAVFNQPFDLGRQIFSWLPGHFHSAELSAKAEKKTNYFSLKEELALTIELDSAGQAVNQVKASFWFDADFLQLNHYQINFDSVEAVRYRRIDDQLGRGELIFQLREKVFKEPIDLVTLHFEAKKTGQTKVGFNRGESFVFQQKNNQTRNLLGRTQPMILKIIKQ